MRQIQPVIHGNARRAGLHLSDHRGAGESLVAKQCQHRGDRLRRTGDQQSAARLRIAQERLLPRREIVRQTYVMAVTCPVAPGAAGVVTLLRERQRRREDRQRLDRKSTRLNSSHSQISYAVFCLKKKKKKTAKIRGERENQNGQRYSKKRDIQIVQRKYRRSESRNECSHDASMKPWYCALKRTSW